MKPQPALMKALLIMMPAATLAGAEFRDRQMSRAFTGSIN
jgi:hypothetical protein